MKKETTMKKRLVMLVMALMLALGITPVMTSLQSAVNVQAADDYPDYYKNAERDAIVDEWNFYNRECTSFCAWCINNRNGVSFTNWYGGIRWGHAYNWGNAAKQLGITVDKTPAVGSIAWWDSGTYGHVAWVSEVKGNTVVIEEYNYKYAGSYNSREINASNPTGYIHIKELAQEYYLDLNWNVDGELIYGEVPCATVDVYINGKRVAKGVKDYYAKHPVGTKYEIKNIKTASGYTYNGVAVGTLKGTLGNQAAEVRLSFSKKTNYRLTGSGTWQYCKLPSGFDKGHSLSSKYNTQKLSNIETSTKKQEVTSPKIVGYIYYHWTHNMYRLVNENYNVLINDHYCWERGREYYNFRAFFSTVEYGHTDPNGVNGGDCCYAWFGNPEDGSWWWFKIPVYEQSYKIYRK